MKEIKNVTLTIGGRPAGRMLMGSTDQAQREFTDLDVLSFTEWYDVDPITEQLEGAAHSVPWKGRKVYFVWLHGSPGLSYVDTDDGSASVSGPTLGRYLRRRPSIRQLKPPHDIVFLECWSDALPSGQTASASYDAPIPVDPWGSKSQAQHTLDSLQVDRAYAPNRVLMLMSGPTPVHGVVTTAAGDLGGFHELRREPDPGTLDELSRIAGLYGLLPESQELRKTTLRLVRGLRQTFGVSVEDDRDNPAGTYQALLSGLGALELMRRADVAHAGRGAFTPELLNRIARVHTGQSSLVHARPTPPSSSDVQATLLAARAALDADSTLDLSSFVALPSVDRALELLRGSDEDARARQVLQIPPGQSLSALDRQALLWATVAAVEAVDNHPEPEALIRQVLHLADYETVDLPLDAETLLWTAAEAAAVGRDIYNPVALAAYDLQRNDALGTGTQMTTQTGRAAGRNWTVMTFTDRIETEFYTVTDPATNTTTSEWMPWDSSVDPYILALEPGNGPDTIIMPWPNQTERSIPYEELAELLRHDTYFQRSLPLDSGLVVVGLDEGSSRKLGDVLSKRQALGRRVFTPQYSLDLEFDGKQNELFLAMTTPQTDRNADWKMHLPEPLATAASGPVVKGSKQGNPQAATSAQLSPAATAPVGGPRAGGRAAAPAIASPREVAGSRGDAIVGGRSGMGVQRNPDRSDAYLRSSPTTDPTQTRFSVAEFSAVGVTLDQDQQAYAALAGGLTPAEAGLSAALTNQLQRNASRVESSLAYGAVPEEPRRRTRPAVPRNDSSDSDLAYGSDNGTPHPANTPQNF
ncbi:lonely Cys domain-containing protein [Streptomyces parvulus]|uniref:lonely Cys domain-containing protein n=1 Tax=Streptomyces parvulus TaxID=146923 RepID=UPI00341B7BDA